MNIKTPKSENFKINKSSNINNMKVVIVGIGKIGGALAKPALKKTLKSFDSSEYGGAPMLGLNGLVVKVHGNATEKEISNAIRQCETFKKQNISQRIADKIMIKDE